MNPVAQGLPVHAADPGRLRSAHAVAHRRKRQEPAALPRVLRPPRQPPKLRRRIVRPHQHRRSHGRILLRPRNHASRARRIAQKVRCQRPWYYYIELWLGAERVAQYDDTEYRSPDDAREYIHCLLKEMLDDGSPEDWTGCRFEVA